MINLVMKMKQKLNLINNILEHMKRKMMCLIYSICILVEITLRKSSQVVGQEKE